MLDISISVCCPVNQLLTESQAVTSLLIIRTQKTPPSFCLREGKTGWWERGNKKGDQVSPGDWWSHSQVRADRNRLAVFLWQDHACTVLQLNTFLFKRNTINIYSYKSRPQIQFPDKENTVKKKSSDAQILSIQFRYNSASHRPS